MKFLNNLIAESAGKWDMPFSTARLLFWIPVLSTLVVIAAAVVGLAADVGFIRDIFRSLLQEDGLIEYVGALGFVIAGVLALLIGLIRRKAQRPWDAALFIVGGVLLLVAAGEEISWGQRIFGWETPEALMALNDQNEFNLHNIGFVLQLTNLAMLLVGLYGTTAYLLNKRVRVERYWSQADFLLIPPFFLSGFFVFVFLFRVLRWTILTESNFWLNRLSEWVETVVALGILAFIWLVYRYVRSARARAEPTALGANAPHE